jgi:serine/threonine protein phosphatase PrpC
MGVERATPPPRAGQPPAGGRLKKLSLLLVLTLLLLALVPVIGVFAETAPPSEEPASPAVGGEPSPGLEQGEGSAAPSPAVSVETEGSPAPETPAAEEKSGLPAMIAAAMAFVGTHWIFFAAALVLLAILILWRILAKRAAGGKGLPYAAVAPGVQAAVLQGKGSYETQEDSYYLSESSDAEFLESHGVLAVVADGMGGLSDGAQVSSLVVSVFARLFPQLPASTYPADKLLYMTECANDEVNSRFGGQPGRCGSTLVSVLLVGGSLWLLSVGDSRIALIRNGSILQLNREHTYAVDLDEAAAKGQISYREAANDPQRRALTSYIGMGSLEHIDRTTKPMRLLPGDYILLMSDGVFNEISDIEIMEALSDDLQASVKKIEKAVLDKRDPGQDNFTALLLRYI